MTEDEFDVEVEDKASQEEELSQVRVVERGAGFYFVKNNVWSGPHRDVKNVEPTPVAREIDTTTSCIMALKERLQTMLLEMEDLFGVDVFARVVEIRRATVRKDDYIIKQSLLHGMSAYLPEPSNLGVEGPTSEGKTYGPVESIKLFPPEDVWMLAGLSPTALAHDHGEMVDETDLSPLENRITALYEALEDLRGERGQDAREQRREYKQQLRELLKRAAFLVNLEGKILLFLDNPNPDTLVKLYPILSHDTYMSKYKFTDRAGKGPLGTRLVLLQGWPVGVFIRTKGSRVEDIRSQTMSRLTLISPIMNPDKYRAAVQHKAETKGLPGTVYVDKNQLWREQWASRAIRTIRNEVVRIRDKARKQANNPRASITWIPYYNRIGEIFPALKGVYIRHADRFLTLIQAHAAFNVFNRPRLVYEDTGDEYIIAVRDDYEKVFDLYFGEADAVTIFTGLPRNVVEFFQRVILPAWNRELLDDGQSVLGEPLKVQPGILIRDLVDRARKTLPGKSMAANTIRQNYVNPLSTAGFVSFEQDPSDARRKIVRVIKEDLAEFTRDNPIFDSTHIFELETLKREWNELNQICDVKRSLNIVFRKEKLTIEDLHERFFAAQTTSNGDQITSRISISGDQAQEQEQRKGNTRSDENHEFTRFLEETGEEP